MVKHDAMTRNTAGKAFNTMPGFSTMARQVSTALLIVMFVLLQFASIEHATAHPFHKHELSCNLLQAVEKNPLDIPFASFGPATVLLVAIEWLQVRSQTPASPAWCYLSRAPPVPITT